MISTLLDAAATLSALALVAVFGGAAVVKLNSLDATANDFAALGLGRTRSLPAAVGVSEAIVAAVLIVRPSVGAVLAGALLGIFTGVVAWALAGGKNVSCGCFGPLSSEPVSSVTIGRNLALLGLAIAAGTRSSLVVPDLAATVTVTAAAATAIVMVQAVMTARRLGRLWSVELAGEMSREATSRSGRSEE